MTPKLRNSIKTYSEINWKKLLREDLGNYHLKELQPQLDFIKSVFDNILNS